MSFGSGDVVSGFQDNTIKGNTIYNNTTGGIYISDNGNVITENKISTMEQGLELTMEIKLSQSATM